MATRGGFSRPKTTIGIRRHRGLQIPAPHRLRPGRALEGLSDLAAIKCLAFPVIFCLGPLIFSCCPLMQRTSATALCKIHPRACGGMRDRGAGLKAWVRLGGKGGSRRWKVPAGASCGGGIPRASTAAKVDWRGSVRRDPILALRSGQPQTGSSMSSAPAGRLPRMSNDNALASDSVQGPFASSSSKRQYDGPEHGPTTEQTRQAIFGEQ